MKVTANANQYRPMPSEYGRVPQGDVVKVGPNTFQTHRYRIEVGPDGEVRVLDLKSKTSVDVWGNGHVGTSDGDKMNMGRGGNLTLDLEDGTKITLNGDHRRGLSSVEGMQIMTQGGGVLVTNMNGPGGPRSRMVADSAALDRMWADGTVLEARGEVDDLHFKCGTEIVGGDPSKRWGEHQLKGMGGRSDIRFETPIGRMGIRELRQLLTDGSVRRMNPDQLRSLIDRIDHLIGGDQWQGIRVRDHRRLPPPRADLPPFGDTFPPLMRLRRDAVSRFAQTTRGSDSFVDGIKGQVSSLSGKINELQDKIKSGEVDKDQLPILQLELQELMQQRTQLIQMATNLARTLHEEQMAVTRNLRLG